MFKMFYKLTLFGMLVIFSIKLVAGSNMNTEFYLKSRISRNSPVTSISGQASLDPEQTKVNRSLLDWYQNQISLTSSPESDPDFKDVQSQESITVRGNASTENGMQRFTNGDVNDSPADNQDSSESHGDTSSQSEKPTKKPKPKNKLRKQRGKSEKGKSRRGKGMEDAASAMVDNVNTETPESTIARLEDNVTQSSEQELGAELSASSPASSILPVANASLTQSNSSTPQSSVNASITSSSVIMLSTEAPSFGNSTVNSSEIHPALSSEHIPSAQPTVIVLLVLLTLVVFIGLGVWWGWWRMKRRQQERLRLQLLPVYNYDPADDQDDWENRLLGESTGLRPKDKPPPAAPPTSEEKQSRGRPAQPFAPA